MLQRILVPLDGSEQAEAVLPYVNAIAVNLESQVTILHAIGGSRAVADLPGTDRDRRSYLERIQADSEKLAEAYLQRQVVQFQQLGVQISKSIVFGRPAEVIVEQGGEGGHDLVAMATRGRSDPEAATLGGAASHVLNNTTVPLLLVRKSTALAGSVARIRELLGPLDTSGLAESVLGLVEELAGGLDLRVSLVAALPTLSQLYLGAELVAHPEKILDRSERELEEYLEGVANRLQSRGVGVNAKVLHGDPAQVVVEESAGRDDRVIVMATHGRTGVGRWVLGSVTDKVVRTGESPVIVVPPPR